MRRLTCALIAGALALAGAAPLAHASAGPHPPWPELLPPLPSSADVQPRAVPGCRHGGIKCIDRVIRRLRRLRDELGCDHRGVFATTYLVLTQHIRQTLKRRPNFFDDRRWLAIEDVVFADLYFAAVAADAGGRPLPEAWRIAFDTAHAGDANAGQDMLLGINAHVQRDMPYVLASVGIRTPSGASRKPDHDRANAILDAAYEYVVRAVEERYDPLLATSNANWNPIDDVAGLEMVKGWREGVWRNAERLLAARGAEERREVERSIEANAAAWARAIAAGEQPGYRAQRDAYCAERLG